ncbi:hypothetical protein BIY24_13055 [Halobacteriovorax marinus]|uniref:Uncharacterized protein n=1 Tax=Halobacteriovorax marinus (strain ATCC BAA-682 / DSM 15412 / SJ) TaxID=862908 RepID=E1WXY8_HALMS|nr:hypothetical protein [Halobacteriovorax marinus]ATH08841.1 hypothetical protein BIY24_13055 [Halobacteriovorax marinus]CBW27543.1 hypothetical protein BMS_2767 [Halobacteriovorax marinus SJ]
MLSRKEQNSQAIALPKEWTEKVCNLLNDVYGSHCKQMDKRFEVYGSTYPNEFVLIATLADTADERAASVSYFISVDLEESTKPEKMLNDLVDSIGAFFDIYFATEDWDDYQAEWLEAEFKGHRFFYKISRENIALHIMADNLLNQ